MNRTLSAIALASAVAFPLAASAREIGEVDTVYKLVGPNHKIKIEAFEDPNIQGVTCFVSRPVSGGISGAIGLAEDPSDVSIACRQTGAIEFSSAISGNPQKPDEVFNEKRSVLFKSLHISRFFDKASNSLVYLTWSDKLFDGSPKNSISAVTLMPWGTNVPNSPKFK